MSWILDLIFFLLLGLGTLYGVYKGFVAGVLKLATIWFALIFAFTFAVGFSNFLETCFGMTTAIARGLESAIANNEAYAAVIGAETSGEAIGDTLAAMDISGIARWFITLSFGSMEVIPADATPAMLIASTLAKWISIVISFVALVIIIKGGAMLIKLIFGAIKKEIKPIHIADQVLGGLLGLTEAFILCFILLLLLNWLPIASLHEFVNSSAVVGGIFRSEWFNSVTSYAVSGQWFTDFMQGLLPS